MGNGRTAGLLNRGGIWHIDKRIRGTRICESTGTRDLAEAQEHLAKRVNEIREARLYGIRPPRSFRAAAIKYLTENTNKRSISSDALDLKCLDSYIGRLPLNEVHMGTLQDFIEQRRSNGAKTSTINAALQRVRRILNLAATEWIDERGLTWLERAPKIKLLAVNDARKPYPLSVEEQAILFRELPRHLARMALFKVNSGCRDHEVCNLRWKYEVCIPELETSVFVVPGYHVKNGEDRLIVLNRVARSVIESVRGMHPEYVFVHDRRDEPKRVARMNNSAWKAARLRAAQRWRELKGTPAPGGFQRVRVHDLKHTFGRRLRAAGVSLEDRQDLLGHKSGRITTHYSEAEIANLIAAAEKACGVTSRAESDFSWRRLRGG